MRQFLRDVIIGGAAMAVVLVVLLAAMLAFAAPPPGADPDSALGRWFESLTRPDFGTPCCSLADCRVYNDDKWRTTPDGYQLLVPEGFEDNGPLKWVDVPPETILKNEENPTGGAVACVIHQRVLCFIRPPDT